MEIQNHAWLDEKFLNQMRFYDADMLLLNYSTWETLLDKTS